VAIPHTDAVHVNKPAVAIGTLKKPVLFHLMGDDEQTVEVQLLFQLAINEPSEQLEMLQSLVGLFADGEFLKSLQQAEDESAVIALIQAELAKA
jgi:PTS system galactitol-specific IIA component